MNYITSKHSTAGSVCDSITMLNSEHAEELDGQINNDEFVDVVENVAYIMFASIQKL